ncbi:hypothetical protein B0T26DRAFT_635002 [Lasiosphaeria miniovina]|uniref:Uncharacterized protein n=1 Tax=Lasiosphaeria miniovina TaxID=1954250 RepID=A0AA40EFQ7_9PEZI|nr:uncharacterized protein B0T26DRAFT_635002 [Lasiosphaeria miniovina]KAK0733548.1 hypothetical protein B0T26DRAFT_635002 [Lasiosphaeria miniovina]
MASASLASKQSIRPHRKSRTGCSTCKRRKVKSLAVVGAGLGRSGQVTAGSPTGTASPLSGTTPTMPTRNPQTVEVDPAPPLDVNNVELLLHFLTTTAETLAGPGSHMLEFWKRNAPHIGLSHNFVLHLIFALAAFHLAYLARYVSSPGEGCASAQPCRRRSRGEYLSLAQQHLTVGLSGFSAQLTRASPENCGALYLGAVLTSYCTFAAGPTSSKDLLVGTANDARDPVGSDSNSPWMPFVYGVRLMHETFSPDVLFTGSMAPLNGGSPRRLLEDPIYVRDGFPRLDWEAALDGLRAYIARVGWRGEDQQVGAPSALPERPEAEPTKKSISLHALDGLIGIYAATYGRQGSDGEITYDGPSENQFIFGWLYRMDRAFVSSVRRREPCAILVLAHYAVLLNAETIPGAWYVESWRQHIIEAVDDFLIEDEHRNWMRWPMEQVVPEKSAVVGTAVF